MPSMQKWQKNLYTIWCTQILSLLGFGFGMPFLPFYIQELGVTDPDSLKIWTGILNAVPGIALAVMAPVWGYLSDRYGKKTMLVRAMIGGSVVMFGLGLSNSVYMVFLFRLLQGVLTGTVTSSAALVATGTPDNRLSYALGFLSSSTFIGYSLGPAFGGLIAEVMGYRLSFFIGGGIVLIGLLLAIFLIEEPPAVQAPPMPADGSRSRLSGVLSLPIIYLFILLFFIRMTRTIALPFLPLYVQETRNAVEGSARISGLLSGGIGFVTALSGITLSRLGDRMNRGNLAALLLGLGTLLSSALLFARGLSGVAAVMVGTYFFIGGVEPMVMSLTSEKVHASRRGFLFGIQTMVGSTAWFISPLLGSGISISVSLRGVFVSFFVLLGITFALAFLVRKKVILPAVSPE